MIEISILELLYLVLTFFLVIVGTLLTLVLIRVYKILSVGIELTNYYWQIKKLLTYYTQASFIMKDKIFDFIAGAVEEEDEGAEKEKNQGQATKK